MGRRPMPVGTYGKIRVKTLGPKRFRARCRYRDFNGKVYDVERMGTSRTDAENNLKAAIRDWVTPVAGATVTASTKFREVAALWLAEVERDAEREFRSWGTVDTYRSRLEGVVLPAVGELRMNELSTPVLDALCKKVREITRLESKRARNRPQKSRALTAAEVLDLLAKLERRLGRSRTTSSPWSGCSWAPGNAWVRRWARTGRTSMTRLDSCRCPATSSGRVAGAGS